MSWGAHLHAHTASLPGSQLPGVCHAGGGYGTGEVCLGGTCGWTQCGASTEGPQQGRSGGAICLPSPLLWWLFQEVHRIVNQALKRYSEDRIGMVDYALESGGVCAALLLQPSPGPRAGLWQLPEQLCARQAGLVRSPPTRTHHKGPRPAGRHAWLG